MGLQCLQSFNVTCPVKRILLDSNETAEIANLNTYLFGLNMRKQTPI